MSKNDFTTKGRGMWRKNIFMNFYWILFFSMMNLVDDGALAAESGKGATESRIGTPLSNEYKKLDRKRLEALNVKLREAMALYYDRSYRLALPLLQEIADEVDTIDVLFWLGKTAYKTNRPTLAIEKFNEILERDPSLLAVRVELATAYLQTGDLASAKKELQVLLDSEAPESLNNSAREMIARIDRTDKRWFTSLRASVGTVYDDNINVGPADNNITLPDGGGTLILPGRLRGWLVESKVNGDVLYDFGERDGFVWRSRLNFFHDQYLDSPRGDFNFTRIDVNSGIEYLTREFRAKLPFGFVNQRFADEELTQGFYTAPNIEISLNDNLEILLGYRYDYEHFVADGTDSQDNSTHRVTLGPRTRFDFGGAIHIATLLGGYTVREASAERFSFDEWSIAPTYFARFQTGTEIFLQGRYQNRGYDSPALLFQEDREDNRYTATAVISQTFYDHFFVSASYTYIRNDSKTPLFDYEKNLVGVNMGVNFRF
ncbi:MAG: tetratricopeptide repeat protein [Methylococcales bacterium]